MRQIGVGTQGGAEALVIYHQLLHDEWTAGSLNESLARIKDEKNCFGMIEWQRRGFFPSTRQQQRGNIETCLMLNEKGSRERPKIVEPMDPWSAA